MGAPPLRWLHHVHVVQSPQPTCNLGTPRYTAGYNGGSMLGNSSYTGNTVNMPVSIASNYMFSTLALTNGATCGLSRGEAYCWGECRKLLPAGDRSAGEGPYLPVSPAAAVQAVHGSIGIESIPREEAM